MKRILLWALESENDAKVVKIIADNILKNNHVEATIQAEGKPKRGIAKQGKQGLAKAVENYLKDSECVIFIIDRDGAMSQAERKNQPNSLINQVNYVISLPKFANRVHLIEAINEIEAWLLVDCIGIFYFFAKNHHSLPKACKNKTLDEQACRDWLQQNYNNIIRKYACGDTTAIEEPESGSKKGVKEYLVKFSEDIYKSLHQTDNKRPITVPKTAKYAERMSPDLTACIHVDAVTIKKNHSLAAFSNCLLTCANQVHT